METKFSVLINLTCRILQHSDRWNASQRRVSFQGIRWQWYPDLTEWRLILQWPYLRASLHSLSLAMSVSHDCSIRRLSFLFFPFPFCFFFVFLLLVHSKGFQPAFYLIFLFVECMWSTESLWCMPFMITTLYAQVPTIHALSDVESYHMISVGVLICEAVLNRRGTQQNTAIRWGLQIQGRSGIQIWRSMDGASLFPPAFWDLSASEAQSWEARSGSV